MNYLSTNIRGVGDSLKATHIKELKKKNNIGFIAIQETQFTDSSKLHISSFWGNTHFESDYVDAAGRSGGLLNIWDPDIFVRKGCVSNRFFLATLGEIKNLGVQINIVNVYAPHDPTLKHNLWLTLNNLISSSMGCWILLGDFNCVREPRERKNSRFNKQTADDFNSFIRSATLSEYAMMGCSFTHRSDDGKRLSKIDRMLVCHTFLSNWPSATLTGLPRYRSDHRPLLLTCSVVKFGAPPFRFFNSWLKEDGLEKLIMDSYTKVIPFGPPDRLLVARLKAIKDTIKPWSMKLKKDNKEILAELLRKVEMLDTKAENIILIENEIQNRDAWIKRIGEIEGQNLEDLKQRAKVKWIEDGDENSSFFHGIVKGHQNTIE
ncbi:uncharacterized protein LOC110897333 [Helianthus annuus]|uniref:uncharacterized protein LOC110897333 n=1 Tax=Helianthus annuus TaxID=4232 RepID=UPI000B8F5C6B|nr:uncharacterized protein LOC110897333 [Helianthus annuus]